MKMTGIRATFWHATYSKKKASYYLVHYCHVATHKYAVYWSKVSGIKIKIGNHFWIRKECCTTAPVYCSYEMTCAYKSDSHMYPSCPFGCCSYFKRCSQYLGMITIVLTLWYKGKICILDLKEFSPGSRKFN